MRLLDSLFARKKNTKEHVNKEVSGKCQDLLKWKQYLDNASNSGHYISRKELLAEIAQYSEIMKFFLSLDENDILEDYCVKNGFDPDNARDLCYQYEHIDEIIDKTNDTYVASKLIGEKDYLDNILKDVDPAISLDEDQRKVVLSDESGTDSYYFVYQQSCK